MKFFIKNKILSSIVLLFLIILTLSIIDMTSISTKYINKSTITFEVNNVRNPQLKKLVRFVDNTYSQIYFSLSKDQKKNFLINKEEYQKLPNEILVEGVKENLTMSNFFEKNNLENWHRSHGNHSSNRFSNLKDINLEKKAPLNKTFDEVAKKDFLNGAKIAYETIITDFSDNDNGRRDSQPVHPLLPPIRR